MPPAPSTSRPAWYRVYGKRLARRLKPLAEWLDKLAARIRLPVFWLLVVLGMAGLVMLTTGVGTAVYHWLNDPDGEARRTIALPGEEVLPEETLPDYRQADPDQAQARVPPPVTSAPEPPTMNWREPQLVRQAAALLADHGDLDAAIALLLANGHSRAELRQVGVASYAAIDQRLRAALPEELAALRTYWEALSPDQQNALYLPEDVGNAAPFARDLSLQITEATWQRLTDSAPPSLFYTLLHNLQVRVRAAVDLPDSLLALIIATRFLPDERTLAMLPPPADAEMIAYDVHLPAYGEALRQTFLHDRFRGLYGEAREAFQAAEEPLRQWYQLAWSEPLCRWLTRVSPTELTDARLERAWEALSPTGRTCWSRQLYLRHVAAYGPLPEPVLRASAWLAPGQEPLPKAATLQLVRQHPAWRDALREFDYEAARAAIPTLSSQLFADAYSIHLKIALQEPLAVEEKQVTQADFPWRRLAGVIGIRQPVPAGLDRERQAPVPTANRFPDWSRVPAETALAALQRLGQQGTPAQRDYYGRIADILSLNRGLRQDEAEADRYPRLDPEPLLRPALP